MRGIYRSRVITAICIVITLWGAQAAWAVKGNPIPIPAELGRTVQGATSAAGCNTVQYDDGVAAYGWISPDAAGDTMQFVRFSPAFACTLKTVQFWVADTVFDVNGDPTITTAGVTVDIYSEAGGFPDTLIASATAPFGSLVFFPSGPNVLDFSSQNLTFDRDFCVVLRRSGTAADTMILLSDDETAGNLRSGEYYVGVGWELIVDGWGIDVDLMVRAELCCGDPPSCTPGAQSDWSTYGGSFARTFKSSASVGNECRLTLDWITQGDFITNGPAFNVSAFSNVAVKDTLAFLSFWNYLSCFNVRTGARLWSTPREVYPEFGQDMRCNVTVDDSLVYLGGGGFRAFNCIRVADGSPVWSYNTLSVPSPTGNTKFCPSVIKDSVVYMPTDRIPGEVFAFNKYTGTLFSGWGTNPIFLPEGGVYNGFATDGDSLLFVGSAQEATTLTNGRLYAVRLANGTIKWGLEDPSAKFLDPTLDLEGFTSSLAYENGILYYQSNIRDDAAGFDHFPWDGSCGAVDVNLENGTGAGILWVAPAAVGRGLYGGPVLGEGVVYIGNDGIFVGDANPKGVIALNKSNGSRLWHNPLDGAGVPMPLTITCEPGGTPYLFAGTRGGLWYLIDGFTGDAIWSRTFSGMVHGTVVLDSQVLVSTRSSLAGNGNGQLASFKLAPANRPRMDVNQLTVFSTNALPGSGNTTVDTIVNALSNSGCANLTISSFGVDTVSVAAVIMPESPAWAVRAAAAADRQAGHWLDFADAFPHRPNVGLMKHGILRPGLGDEDGLWKPQAREFARRAVTAAAAQVVTVENTTPATVLSGNSLNITLRINEAGQTPRTTVRNFITLNTNDPDFFPEDTSYTELGFPVIAVDAIFGYARQQDTLRGMDALSQVTNHGAMGVNDDAIFYVEGDLSASLFDGSFLVSGKVQDTARTAWDNYDWLEFQPDDFLTVTYDTAVATTTGFDQVTGTISQARYVDSIGFPDSAAGTFGVSISETQVGLNQVGSGSPSFKLVQQCVVNRNATAVDSPLYLGTFTDFDVESSANNVDTTHVTAWSAVYEYDPSSSMSAYGIIKLPKPGTVFRQPDGTLDTATGFRGVYAVYNPDEVYPSGAFSPISDSIYNYVSGTGLRSRGGFNRNGDMSMACTFDRVNLSGNDTAYAYYALFGTAAGGNLDAAALQAAIEANLMSGFARGDVNGDGSYNFLDLVWLYDWIQSGGTTASPIPRPAQGDVNADGNVNMADVTYLENFLYNDGPAPVGQWWW